MPLITGAQVRQHTPQIAGTAEDSNFETVVNRADALMAAYCRWPRTSTGVYTMQSTTYVLYPRPWHEDPRALGYELRWVTAVASAYIDEDWAYGAATQVTAADLLIDNDEGVLWLVPLATSFSAWSQKRRANKVTLTAGFVTTPEDLIVAAAFAVRHLLGRGRTGGNVASRAGESVTPADADMLLPKATKEALGVYMRVSALVA
jgi:hypothetical protein